MQLGTKIKLQNKKCFNALPLRGWGVLHYQPGEKDQFYHRYEYDAENRITDVFTTNIKEFVGTRSNEDHEAFYQYYKHSGGLDLKKDEKTKSMVLSLKINKSMQKIRIIVILSMVFLGSRCFSQTTKTIDCLEESYQACLDKGANMLGCSKVFYQQMDSMLNLVYKKLRKEMSSLQSSKLKVEQIKWLAKRDQYFKNIKLAPEEEALEEEDREMVIIDKKSAFVKERVIELVTKL